MRFITAENAKEGVKENAGKSNKKKILQGQSTIGESKNQHQGKIAGCINPNGCYCNCSDCFFGVFQYAEDYFGKK